jgi:hypothetical protein
LAAAIFAAFIVTYAKFRNEMVDRRGVALSIRQGISVADGLLNEPISHDPR